MIINSGNDQGHHNTRYTDRCLFFKIKHIISIFHFRHIGTGTVQHNQSKADQKHYNCHQTVIVIICPGMLYGSACFCTRNPALLLRFCFLHGITFIISLVTIHLMITFYLFRIIAESFRRRNELP